MNDKEIINKLVRYINQLVEGDTHMMDSMQEFLIRLGFWDDDGFLIDDDDI